MVEKKKKPNANKNKKELKISALGIADNIIFSKNDVVAFYKIKSEVFEFLSSEAQINTANLIKNAFINLMGGRQESLDVMTMTTSKPYNVEAWESQVLETAKSWDQPAGFKKFMDAQVDIVTSQDYSNRVSYICVHLNKRGALNMDGLNFMEAGLEAAVDTLKTWVTTTLKTPTEAISRKEESDARAKEREIFRTLQNGSLKAERTTALEILRIIKSEFYPAMPVPYVDVDNESRIGPGELAMETASAIENKYRWLKITQMHGNEEVHGYRSNLTLSKFEKTRAYPYDMPFFYLPYVMGGNFTTYARFRIHPNAKMKKELAKKEKEQMDELQNLAQGQDQYTAAIKGGMPTEVSGALQDRQALEELLKDGIVWIEGSYHIVIEARTEDDLKDICSTLIQAYKNYGITLYWNAGDQASLFLEQMPGDYQRSKAFDQMTSLDMLSTSGFNFSSDIGDPIFENN